jgi:regulator of sigma E protease
VDFSELISAFGGTVWAAVALIVALSVIVAVHEFGHYIVGRWSGIHAEVFSIGFGRPLWSRIDSRGTKWQVALWPLGGFVRFMGDSNAASGPDGEMLSGLTPEERRHTMHGAPLWARASTVLAGPVFNFVLTFLVFCGVLFWSGMPTDRAYVGTVATTPFQGPSLETGDLILAINGQPVVDRAAFLAHAETLPAAPEVDYLVQRGEDQLTVKGPHPQPALIGSVMMNSAAYQAEIQPGDVVTEANGVKIWTFNQLPPLVAAGEGAPVDLVIWRAGEEFRLELTPKITALPLAEGGFENAYKIGLGSAPLFEPETRRSGLLETPKLAAEATWNLGVTTLSGLWHIVTGTISSCNLSGAIGMAKVVAQASQSGVLVFLQTIAMLSLGIGLLNLLPIPVLDGGHLMFHAWEATTGRPPSDAVLRVLMAIGLTLILTLMIYALSNDLTCP